MMIMIFRIFADFNSIQQDEEGEWIPIGKEGSWQIDEYPFKSALKPGGRIRLFDTELQVDAVLGFDEINKYWFGRPDWTTKRDLDSAASGLEEFSNAAADVKLSILRYETRTLIAVIRGNATLLKKILSGQFKHDVPDSMTIVEDLVRMTKDLEEVQEILTEA
jgi:hypothetical protein